MKRIGITGLEREAMQVLIEQSAPGRFTTQLVSDMDAANSVKRGDLHYTIGAFHSGIGPALAVAVAVLGSEKCCTISSPDSPAREQQIARWVRDGKVAFGISIENASRAIPLLVHYLDDA
ncbi:DUF2620 family protein [Cedecea davisae]|uniref:DUF2620 family protein n=1 Tax=Cedecea davisae TaxID=158484 RepID=A0ABS6DC22_9ENTR|nr:DUF2620 family protein [Cedecea davisae]MBU4680743.1 DUF2620 family protein [Cedecea davisae]MBU4686616.1 DUF2620 family protein [Cedecea davisae]